MASKTVKKKASAKQAAPFTAKPKSASSKTASTIIPFGSLTDPIMKSLAEMEAPKFSNETMETTMNTIKNQYEKMTCDASSTVRESVECLTKSTSTLTKGAEQILKTIADVAQECGQRNAEAMKSLMACRTLNEFAEAQNKMAQQNFDEAMSCMTKLSEMTIKLCSEAMEPINGQMTKAMTSCMSAAKKNAA